MIKQFDCVVGISISFAMYIWSCMKMIKNRRMLGRFQQYNYDICRGAYNNKYIVPKSIRIVNFADPAFNVTDWSLLKYVYKYM